MDNARLGCTRIDELEAESRFVLDDTIIFYFGDNGGVLPFSKRFASENAATACPLIIWFGRELHRHLAPGLPRGDRRSHRWPEKLGICRPTALPPPRGQRSQTTSRKKALSGRGPAPVDGLHPV